MNSRQRDNDRKPMVVSVITVKPMSGYQADGPMYMYLGQAGVTSRPHRCFRYLSILPRFYEFTQGHPP
jgi:hypothetical protein